MRSKRSGKGPIGARASDVLAEEIRRDPELRMRIDVVRRERLRKMLARLVAEARKRGGLSQAKVAAKAGMWQAHLSRLESGKDAREPTLSLLARVAEAMGYRLDLQLVPLRKAG